MLKLPRTDLPPRCTGPRQLRSHRPGAASSHRPAKEPCTDREGNLSPFTV